MKISRGESNLENLGVYYFAYCVFVCNGFVNKIG
ncbi:hypothetical protein BROOK1789C_2108 [Bathymodiolus brooksi thiotrophic gill symbiont]|nr:hypothetical protein BROOK1789C_2108 [Bathymodiolus brooksi thiotrophic gill symbiont]